jgi:PTS system glucose-specific IIA component
MQLFSKDKKMIILAPLTGEAVTLEQVPDDVFSNRILGDGIAIIPGSNEVFAPVSGTIAQIAHTLHAIGIEGDNGTEVLVHLGIDTVELKGEGFTCHVKVGQHITAGDKLMDMDIELIKSRGYQTISPCILTNSERIRGLEIATGDVIGGKSTVMTFKK